MNINVIVSVEPFQGTELNFLVNPNDKIETLMKRIKDYLKISNEPFIRKICDLEYRISIRHFLLTSKSIVLDLDKSFYELQDFFKDTIIFKEYINIYGAGAIDNLNDENSKDIGFDMNLIKRTKLSINLIYFDKNIKKKENYDYYVRFKIDVEGGFYAIDNIDILKKYLDLIKLKDIPFIVISSGSSGKEVINLCLQYLFIKEVIIFCNNYKYNQHYIKEYPGYVKKVFTVIEPLYEYLKQFSFSQSSRGIEFFFTYEQIKMEKQIDQCPLIVSKEYDQCYFLIHRAYSHFFGNMLNNENPFYDKRQKNITKVLDYCYKFIKNNKDQVKLFDIFQELFLCEGNNIFVEKAIRAYSSESSFCYLFNRAMRNFSKGLMLISHFMGPLLFGLNKYVKDNPSFAFSKDMTLYRKIKCPK